MANICRTEIDIFANQSAIDWFEKLIKDYMDEDFIGQFGSEGENNIERIGCKWIQKYDWYREDSTQYFISFESAWYPPDTMIKNIINQLQEYDKHAYASGRYWDENFSPIGIFQCNSIDMFETAETDVDVDWDNEYYWDEIEAAFENLEL